MAMPQMSGLDVLKKLKESDTISHDKIVLLYITPLGSSVFYLAFTYMMALGFYL
jgi:response regulator RpfG family c-di-GMP phosphodiesterase